MGSEISLEAFKKVYSNALKHNWDTVYIDDKLFHVPYLKYLIEYLEMVEGDN